MIESVSEFRYFYDFLLLTHTQAVVRVRQFLALSWRELLLIVLFLAGVTLICVWFIRHEYVQHQHRKLLHAQVKVTSKREAHRRRQVPLEQRHNEAVSYGRKKRHAEHGHEDQHQHGFFYNATHLWRHSHRHSIEEDLNVDLKNAHDGQDAKMAVSVTPNANSAGNGKVKGNGKSLGRQGTLSDMQLGGAPTTDLGDGDLVVRRSVYAKLLMMHQHQ